MVTDTATALRLLPIASAHSSQLYLSGSLSVLALGGLAVSSAAIARLVTGRGWVIATIAALLGGLGAFAGAMLNVLGGISLAVAASAHTTQAAGAQFLVTSFGSSRSGRRLHLLRQRIRRAGRHGVRAVAQPSGAALAGRLVHRRPGGRLLHGRYRPQVVLFMLPFAAAMILLAVRIWPAAARPAAMTDPEQAHHADQLAGTSNGI